MTVSHDPATVGNHSAVTPGVNRHFGDSVTPTSFADTSHDLATVSNDPTTVGNDPSVTSVTVTPGVNRYLSDSVTARQFSDKSTNFAVRPTQLDGGLRPEFTDSGLALPPESTV